MVKLGSEVRDSITGFRGVATGRAVYLYGCAQICIAPKSKDGKLAETCWFDEQRIEVLKEGGPRVSKWSEATTGGPQDAPLKRADRMG